jgi:hypothetical protein
MQAHLRCRSGLRCRTVQSYSTSQCAGARMPHCKCHVGRLSPSSRIPCPPYPHRPLQHPPKVPGPHCNDTGIPGHVGPSSPSSRKFKLRARHCCTGLGAPPSLSFSLANPCAEWRTTSDNVREREPLLLQARENWIS